MAEELAGGFGGGGDAGGAPDGEEGEDEGFEEAEEGGRSLKEAVAEHRGALLRGDRIHWIFWIFVCGTENWGK